MPDYIPHLTAATAGQLAFISAARARVFAFTAAARLFILALTLTGYYTPTRAASDLDYHVSVRVVRHRRTIIALLKTTNQLGHLSPSLTALSVAVSGDFRRRTSTRVRAYIHCHR